MCDVMMCMTPRFRSHVVGVIIIVYVRMHVYETPDVATRVTATVVRQSCHMAASVRRY